MAASLSLSLYRGFMTALSPLLPLYLARRIKAGKEDAARLGERYGRYDAPFHHDGTTIWLHAISVGEAMAALALAKDLRARFKDAHFIITTGTMTSAEIVQKAAMRLPISHVFAPFDAPRFVRRFFDYYQPDFGVIFESDFWPVMMTSAHDKRIPLFLASAQMSEASAANWAKRPALARDMFAPIAACFAHDAAQADNFQAFGISDSKVTGSLKLPPFEETKTDFASALLKTSNSRLILLGASTHAGEETALLQISQRLTKAGIVHLLIIAPRHPNRGDEVAKMMPNAKRRSQNQLPESDCLTYLCDSLGDMPSLYQAADIVWLGATFVDRGGHNPLEPASYGKPVICGRSHFKNRHEFEQLTKLGVCQIAHNNDESIKLITALAQDKDTRATIAKAGKAYAKKAASRPAKTAASIEAIWREGRS